MMIREPSVAGSFYPGSVNALKHQVEQFMANAEESTSARLPCVLIVPHAGYVYSGQVAAHAYAAIEPPERVLLLGVSHHFHVDGTVAYDGDGWQTPLGIAEVDRETIANLCQSSLIHVDNSVHQPEHGLEVQLPFLQSIAPDATIVPLLMSDSSWNKIDTISAILSEYCDDRTVLLVSSDLSHYPSGATADIIDNELIEAILAGDVQGFHALVRQKPKGVSTRACGAVAIAIGMLVAQRLGLKKVQKLAYAHSGHISGDMSRVVGYTSICFSY